MQQEHKMDWWFSLIAVLLIIMTACSLVFAISGMMIARKTELTANEALLAASQVAKQISITVQTQKENGVPADEADKTAAPPDSEDTPEDVTPSASLDTEASVSYTVKEYNGGIAVYDKNGSMIQTVDYPVRTLNQTDRAALEKGIPVGSAEELMQLLQDLAS